RARAWVMACSPLPASPTTCMTYWRSITSRKAVRTIAWSSTSRTPMPGAGWLAEPTRARDESAPATGAVGCVERLAVLDMVLRPSKQDLRHHLTRYGVQLCLGQLDDFGKSGRDLSPWRDRRDRAPPVHAPEPWPPRPGRWGWKRIPC